MRSKSQLHHHSWASILLYTVIYNSVKDELEHKVSTGNNKAEKAAVMYKRKDKAFESAAAVGID